MNCPTQLPVCDQLVHSNKPGHVLPLSVKPVCHKLAHTAQPAVHELAHTIGALTAAVDHELANTAQPVGYELAHSGQPVGHKWPKVMNWLTQLDHEWSLKFSQ